MPEIAKSVKKNPFFIKLLFQSISKYYSVNNISQIMKSLASIDTNIKTGVIKPEQALLSWVATIGNS